MKRQGLSLRYKILFLLTAIPALALSAYLLLAKQVFESDKVAYVFDATSSMSATIAAQIKTQLSSVLVGSKPILQDFLTQEGRGQRGFSQQGRILFGDDKFTEAIVVYGYSKNGRIETVGAIEKSQGIYSQLTSNKQTELGMGLNVAMSEGRFVMGLDSEDRVLLLEKTGSDDTIRIFSLITRLPELAEIFKTSMSQSLYLVGRGGQLIFSPQGVGAKNILELIPLSPYKTQSQKIAQGAETVKASNGDELLASYSRVGFGDLVVVSTVSKDKALSAVGILVRKSGIFFVILICAVMIISLLASGRLTKALSSLFDATQKVAEGDFNVRVNVTSQDEVGALADNFNLMAAEVSRLLDQTAEKARMESELQTAKTVQETLFPENKTHLGGLEISGFYEPASECGGDWWHYCQVGSKVFLWIGDATGHGAPAALITSAAKSASAIIENMNVGPGEAMALLNKAIFSVSKGKLMMTFFVASFDEFTGILTYANASHEAPFLIKAGSTPLKKKNLIPLNEVGGARLGQDRNSTYEEARVKLDPSDMIFFYTDGIPDIRSPSNEEWGERQFIRTMIESHKDFPSAEKSVNQFVETFQTFRQGSQLVDDVTFFVVKATKA